MDLIKQCCAADIRTGKLRPGKNSGAARTLKNPAAVQVIGSRAAP
jgi:hypothetical protein